MKTEQLILSNLVSNETFMRKVFPFINREYFSDQADRTLFELIDKHIDKYNACPNKELLLIELGNREDLNESSYKGAKELIEGLTIDPLVQMDWLVDTTEKFCQDKALYNAVLKSIQIMDDKDRETPRSAIPGLLTNALAISFDSKLGHDYLDDAETRYDFYHTKVSRIPFDIEILNQITKGGVPKKTLNIILAGCVHPDTKVKIRYRKRSSDPSGTNE